MLHRPIIAYLFTLTHVLFHCEIIQDNIHKHPPSTDEGNGLPKWGEFLSAPPWHLSRCNDAPQQAGQAKLGKVSSSQGAFVYRLYLAYYLSRISPGSMALHNWQTARASQVKPGCFCGSARVRLCTDIPVPVHCTSNTPTWHTMIHLDLGKLSSWKGLIRDALA